MTQIFFRVGTLKYVPSLVTIDVSMPIHFYRLGYVSPATTGYCTWWTFFDYSLTAVNVFLMAIISVQRHILIFQGHLLQVPWKRYLLHYTPLFLGMMYPIIFYFSVVVLYPCNEPQWDYTSNLCGTSNCYLLYDRDLSMYDWIVNVVLPLVVIILANVALVIRVISQKRRLQQHISWQSQRRMTLQLLGISSLYLIAWLPTLIIGIIQQFSDADIFTEIQTNYTLDLIYLICLFLPWVYIGLLPKFKKWLFKCLYRRRGRVHNATRPL